MNIDPHVPDQTYHLLETTRAISLNSQRSRPLTAVFLTKPLPNRHDRDSAAHRRHKHHSFCIHSVGLRFTACQSSSRVYPYKRLEQRYYQATQNAKEQRISWVLKFIELAGGMYVACAYIGAGAVQREYRS